MELHNTPPAASAALICTCMRWTVSLCSFSVCDGQGYYGALAVALVHVYHLHVHATQPVHVDIYIMQIVVE